MNQIVPPLSPQSMFKSQAAMWWYMDMGPLQWDLCPFKRQLRAFFSMWEETVRKQEIARKRIPSRNRISWHLDPGLPNLQNRKNFSCLSHPVGDPLLQQPHWPIVELWNCFRESREELSWTCSVSSSFLESQRINTKTCPHENNVQMLWEQTLGGGPNSLPVLEFYCTVLSKVCLY